MLSELTPREMTVLSFIQDYSDSHPYCPSMREIGKAIGGTKNKNKPASMSLVSYYLSSLKKRGLIDMVKRESRTVHLTTKGRIHLADLTVPKPSTQTVSRSVWGYGISLSC